MSNLSADMLCENFAGIVPADDFLQKYLPRSRAEASRSEASRGEANRSEASRIDRIVTNASPQLAAAGEKVSTATDISAPLIEYLEKVVSDFDEQSRPLIHDTHKVVFPSVDDESTKQGYTKPDITVTQPGMKKAPTKWQWAYAGTVIELKHITDVFDDHDELNKSLASRKALVQLAKSARSLLMASGSCHVYVVSVFDKSWARIFRFDHSGFRATAEFNWITSTTIFPTFFYRLYNPPDRKGHIWGADDTVSVPTANEKTKMYKALRKNRFYVGLYPALKDATENSLWIKAVRFSVAPDGTRGTPQIVKCFTIGPLLWNAGGLFSRATRVFRVLIEEDIDHDTPTVYALKDAWRQECRRPEIDFYDVIAKYCADPDNGVDPSEVVSDTFERCHMRSLLTPVGAPLNGFKSTKSLAHAIQSAIMHHEIAFNAGVIHRDVSEGNVLFEEVVVSGKQPQGFLLDWDYAEFTEAGLKAYQKWFPERAAADRLYTSIDKSLKDMTGTLPFMAIAIIGNFATHGPHHDLESFYWLLVWMILRHTNHTHSEGSMACSNLFDHSGNSGIAMKRGWLQDRTPIGDKTSALFKLVDKLRKQVRHQNPGNDDPVDSDDSSDEQKVVHLTHGRVLDQFTKRMESDKWPKTDDPALDFVLPKALDQTENRAPSLLKNTLEQQARATGSAAKRRREEDSPAIASASSEGTTAAASIGSAPKAKKAKTTAGASGSWGR
ncbi:hypothetical protein DFH07DRAFT_930040 [Mycena maculata]|uniref:Fungal-type protein kinase domain-containing protein n=1 Tax=Mycena maculata TaxID=230809 RepID=A0AAD7MRC2_9AGAR|nr:hypothetical protein DFH07DRAFT_930040 [Mycena maculata]